MIAWLAALQLAFAPAPAAAMDPLVGSYETRQIEVVAMLDLKADGSFRYMLDYGAVSEASDGQWTAAAGVVHLDSDPLAMPLLTAIERSDANFRDEQLAIDGDSLVMRRHDTVFTFYRAEP